MIFMQTGVLFIHMAMVHECFPLLLSHKRYDETRFIILIIKGHYFYIIICIINYAILEQIEALLSAH